MALGDKKNIIVGAASVYLGPAGTDKPAYVANEKYRLTLDGDASWRNVGYTQDGLEIATDPSWGEVEVDQLLDSAKIFKDGMSLSINTTFAEATLENLLIVWGQSDTDLRTSGLTPDTNAKEAYIEGGSLGEAPLERGLIAVGNATEQTSAGAPSNKYGERVYHAYRVLSVEGGSHTLARSEATTIPVTFRALPEDTNGRYGVVRDRLTTAV